MASRVLIPLLGPSSSGAPLELVEADWVIPRLLEHIRDLEEQLIRSKLDEKQPDNNSVKDRVLKIAGSSIDAGISFIARHDAKKHLTHETTSKALDITVNKLNSMKNQIYSLEGELRAAQEEAATARHRAKTAEALAIQSKASYLDELETLQRIFEENVNRLRAEAESAKAAATTSAHDISSLKISLEKAKIDQFDLITSEENLEMATQAAYEWKERCVQAEQLVASTRLESESIKAARSGITHDLNAIRAHLTEVQSQAEDFQRRFLAERLERRRLHEELQTLRGNIRVVCRVRPAGTTDKNNNNNNNNNKVNSKQLAVSFPMEACIRVAASERRTSEFEFSSVLEPHSSQQDVFEEVWPALRSCLDGHNVCIFAYGQTGSGKTHTVIGNEENPGIAPRALRALFDVARKEDASSSASSSALTGTRKFSVSMLEIYMDTIRDLLGDNKCLEVLGLGPLTAEHIAAGVERVPGRTWLPISCAHDAQTMLVEGCAARATASTSLNATSSRSHLIFTLKLHDETTSSCSMLHLVDLAGSERVARSEAEGQQLKEAQAINKSLSTLGDVVASLQAGSSHVPYRNSKLTCLLQDSLGGSSKVLLTCCVAPELESAGETLSTLNFAQRAALVELGPSVVAAGSSSNSTNSGGVVSSSQAPPSPQASTPSASKSKIPSPARMNVKTPSPTMARSLHGARSSPLRPQK